MSGVPTLARRRASEQDILAALCAMEGLPRRALDDAEMALAGYLVALEGVAAADLAEAVRRVLRGELGHAFLPSPPELRIVVDRARRDAEAPRLKLAATARLREQLADRRRTEPDAETKARVAARYAQFCATWPGAGRRA